MQIFIWFKIFVIFTYILIINKIKLTKILKFFLINLSKVNIKNIYLIDIK